MVSNFAVIKDTLRFDKNKVITDYLNAVRIYDLEEALGNLLKLLSIIGLLIVNVAALSRGRLIIIEIFSPDNISLEVILSSLLITVFCYGLYLTRDKNRYQSVDHSDLRQLKQKLSMLSPKQTRKAEIQLTNYMDSETYELLAKYLLAAQKSSTEEYSLTALLQTLFEQKLNQDLLVRLGLSRDDLKVLQQKIKSEGILLAANELERQLQQAFILALSSDFQYFDQRAIVLGILLYAIPDQVNQLGIDDATINAFVKWLRSKEYRRKLFKQIKENQVLRPFSTVNPAMTSVYSEAVEHNTDDLTFRASTYAKQQTVTRKNVFQVSFRRQEVADMVSILDSEGGLCLLIGHAGVGKTTMIETLTLQMLAMEVPKSLQDKRLLELNVSKLISQAKSSSDIAGVLQKIFVEQEKSGNIVMIIDDIDQLLNLQADMQKEVVSLLAAELNKIEVKMVATITPSNYNRYLKQIPELSSLFSNIEIAEATVEESLQILVDELPYFSAKHKVNAQYTTLKRICELSPQYDFNKFLPDKAIDTLDQIMQTARSAGRDFIDKEFVDEYLEKKVGLKLGVAGGEIDSEEQDLLQNLETEIRKHVIAQNEAVETVARALRRARVGFEKGNRPVAAFLFYGPTGVGKTELSKTIARVYFGDQKLMLRLDMSEFQKPSDIDKLIGYSEGNEYRDGQLTQYVLQHPFSLILLDELEKAHPKVLDIFLQILDNGVITDGIGRDVSFKNTIIVATSNAGSNLIASEVAKNKTYKQIRPLAAERLKSYFRIEFLNRFDAVVMFHPLSISDAHQIAEMLLFREKDLLKQKGIEFVFSKQLVDRLVNKGFNQQYGARSLKRQITSKVRDKVAEAVIAGHLQPGDVFSLE